MDYSTQNLRYLAERAGVVYMCQDEQTLRIQLRKQRNIAETHYQIALHIAGRIELEDRHKAFLLSELRVRLETYFASVLRQKMIRSGCMVRFSPNASNHAGSTGTVVSTEVSWTKQGLPVVMLRMESEARGTLHCVIEVLLHAWWVSSCL